MQTTRKRILVAEDDPSIATMIVRALSNEHEVVLARDGHEAVSLASRQAPQLLLLDVMMPGLDGLSVARQVRALPGLRNVPIIFLTAKDGSMDVIKGIQHGARHYITKPFKLDDLRAKIKKTLGS